MEGWIPAGVYPEYSRRAGMTALIENPSLIPQENNLRDKPPFRQREDDIRGCSEIQHKSLILQENSVNI